MTRRASISIMKPVALLAMLFVLGACASNGVPVRTSGNWYVGANYGPWYGTSRPIYRPVVVDPGYDDIDPDYGYGGDIGGPDFGGPDFGGGGFDGGFDGGFGGGDFGGGGLDF